MYVCIYLSLIWSITQHEQVEIRAWQTTSVCTRLFVTDRMFKVHRLTLEEAVNSG